MFFYLRNSILATLVYYDVFDFPLTAFEIYKYLINPGRLSRPAEPIGEIFLNDIEVSLADLLKSGIIGSKNGFYFLANRDKLSDLRIEREKIASRKWKKLLKISKWFQLIPYLRGVIASGSLAMNNTDSESDFDVLVIAKSGRLYVCRIILSLVASLFGARRQRFDSTGPDKFCFNHYITDRTLKITHESLYNAQTYINLKPILVNDELFKRFYLENIWLNKFVFNFRPGGAFLRNSIASKSTLFSLARLGEFVLDSRLGSWLEFLAKKYQQKRIKSNPLTYESGGRVVFDDGELEFHPRSFETHLLKKYNQGLKRLGIISCVQEKDSGLTKSDQPGLLNF